MYYDIPRIKKLQCAAMNTKIIKKKPCCSQGVYNLEGERNMQANSSNVS